MEGGRLDTELVQKDLVQTRVDLTAETVVRELTSRNVPAEQILFTALSAFRRGHERDVARISSYRTVDGQERITVQVNRDGLVDTLPQALFYQPDPREEANADEQDKTDGTQYRSKQMHEALEAARTFFRPFDNISLLASAHLETIEHEAFSTNIPIKTQLCDLLWPEMKEKLSISQKSKLLTMTLTIHKLVGQWSVIERLLSDFMELPSISENETPIEIIPVQTSTLTTDKNFFSKLGEAKLGVNSFLYIQQVINYAFVQIKIKLLESGDTFSYMPGMPKWQLLNFLAELVMPLEINWELKVVNMKGGQGFELNRFKPTSLLGITTTL